MWWRLISHVVVSCVLVYIYLLLPSSILFMAGGPEKTPEEWLEFLQNLGTNPDRRPVEVRSCSLVPINLRAYFDSISKTPYPSLPHLLFLFLSCSPRGTFSCHSVDASRWPESCGSSRGSDMRLSVRGTRRSIPSPSTSASPASESKFF